MNETHDVRITVSLPGGDPTDITLSYPLDPQHQRLLEQLHQTGKLKGAIECRMHDDDPKLRGFRSHDGRVHEAWLYLRRSATDRSRLLLCHWPHSLVSGSHAVPSPMTAEHRRRQEYVALRGEAAGYEVELEKSIAPGTRSDVVIRGVATMTAEVQQTGIALPTVLRRDRSAVSAGAVPAWLSDTKAPHYAFKVAHVETNEREGMDPRTWTVSTGPRELEHEKCTPSSRLGHCPDRRRGWCGMWHPIWVPRPGLTVDDVVEQVPAGALVRLETGTAQGVVLVSPGDRDAWLTEVESGRLKAPRLPEQRGRQQVSNHANYSAEKLRRRITDDAAKTPQQPGGTCPNWGRGPCGYKNTPCGQCPFAGGAA